MNDENGNLVLDVLHKATSQDTETLRSAEKQLKVWESEPGFYTVLMSVFSNKGVEVKIRWQAILYLKNGVDRYWRRLSPGAIKDEEKAKIKQMLLENFHEPINQLAIQLAVVIGKIARLDCPKQWPELLPALMDAIRTVNDELRQQRILLSLYQVVKCLSSRRLAHDRKVFEEGFERSTVTDVSYEWAFSLTDELTNGIFQFMLDLWTGQMNQFDEYLTGNNLQRAHLMLEYAHLTLKVLRKLVVYGFKNPGDCDSVNLFIQLCICGIENLLAKGNIFSDSADASELCKKVLILYSKILLDMLAYHSEMYILYINSSLELVYKLCFSGSFVATNFERFNVNLLNLMKSILCNESYRPQSLQRSETDEVALTAHQAIKSAMTTQVLSKVFQALVTNYLPLSITDLELWESDPEDYVNEEGGSSYKYNIKPCVECLFAALFKEFAPIITPILIGMVRENGELCDPADISSVLKKDALYHAVGLAAYDIYEEVDFDKWLQERLLNEFTNTHPNYRVVKRRVLWLIGMWISVKLSVSMRPVVYQTIFKMLHESEDVVVRLEAAFTLRAAVDDFEFTYKEFSTYMEPSFHLLFNLLTAVESCDSKMQVLQVMSLVIERTGSHIAPHCQILIHYLPQLWQQSEEHNMLQSAIITTLTGLVNGLASECVLLDSLVIPVIQLSTDLNRDAHVYLLEDGLLLWQAVLYNRVAGDETILQLFTALPPLLDMSSENLRICLKIVEAYSLLCGQLLISTYGNILVDCFCNLVTDLKSEGLVLVLKAVELFFKLYSRASAQLFKNLIVSWVVPSILDGETYPMVMSLYLSIISRVTLEDRNLLFTYIADYSQLNNKQQIEVMSEFLQMWFEKLDCVSHSERRKVCALGIATLIPTELGTTEIGLDPMVNACVQVMHDVCTNVSSNGNLQITDTVVLDVPEKKGAPADELDNNHEKRKHEMSLKDPVFHIHLHSFVWDRLKDLCNIVGEEKFRQLIASIDSDISSQLQDFMVQI